MGFGQGQQEKDRNAQIGQNTQVQQQAGQDSLARGQKAFKWFKQSAKPAQDFWGTILSGDRNAIDSLFAPEIQQTGSQFDQAINQNNLFTPRGGARAVGNTQLLNQKAQSIGNILNQARPMAADKLGDIAGLFANVSGQQSGQGGQFLNNATGNLFNLNQQDMENRRTKAQFWGGLGQSAGSLAGAWLLGKQK
jgi:hypothetical protein